MTLESGTALVLRSAGLEDLDYITGAEAETAAISFGQEETSNKTRSRHQRLERALETGNILMAELAGRVVGYYWIEAASDGVPFLVDFYVDPAVRGQSIGDRLLRRAVSSCARSGARVLRLAISDRNTASVRFFTRNGAICKDIVPSKDRLREYELTLEGFA